MKKEKENITNSDQTTKSPTKTKKTMWEKAILPNKDKIVKLVENGASERQIASALKMSWNCWIETKKKHPEMEEWIDRPRALLVGKLKSALISRALGYTYEEEITEEKQDIDENGKAVGHKYVYHRKITQHAPPDTTAIFACLKIYDKDNIHYDDKAQIIDIKRKELELKEKTSGIESENSDLAEKIKGFEIKFVDASRKEGENNEQDKGN